MRSALIQITAVIMTLSVASAHAADKPSHSLDELSWLTGHWLDHRNPNVPIEVRWEKKSGDAMVGTWRKTRGGALVAYESLTMRRIGADVVYRFDLYTRDQTDDVFSLNSTTRLSLVSARENHAEFVIIGEENWRLNMDVEDGVLSGFMHDQNKPDAERLYSYVAKKQPPS